MLKGNCYNNEAIYQMQMQGYEQIPRKLLASGPESAV